MRMHFLHEKANVVEKRSLHARFLHKNSHFMEKLVIIFVCADCA